MATDKGKAIVTEAKTKTVKPAIKSRKTVKKTAPKKRGRKPWVPDYQFIEDQARNGLTDKQIAALTGIHHNQFCTKKTELPELAAALDRGRAKGVSMASTALWKLIAQGDRQAAQFYLERKGGWKEQTENTNHNLNAEVKDKETINSMIDAIAKVRAVGRK
jgi:hypothetical protein